MDIAPTHVNIRVEGRCAAICHVYPDRWPILAVDSPAGTLLMCGRTDGSDSDGELRFAESLLVAVQTYRDQVQAWALPPTAQAVAHPAPATAAGEG